MALMGSSDIPSGPSKPTSPARSGMLTNRSFQTFILALAGIGAVSALLATGSIPTDVGTPILSGIVLGGVGLATNPPSNP